MTTRRVVVTALGAVTPVGNNVPAFWESLLAGRSGAGPITRFDSTHHKTHFACEVKDFRPEDFLPAKEVRRLDRFVQFGIVAAEEVLKDSGLEMDGMNTDEFGVIIGSGVGGLEAMEEQHRVYMEKGPGRVSPFLVPRMISNMAAGHISIRYGLRGPNMCPVTACTTGTHAIGDAFKLIQRGQANLILAGGTEAAITPLGVAGFENMKALSSRNDAPEKASRPFDAERDGFVIGEGAGLLLLEDYEHAKARGAKIYCEVVGYGATADAHHMTAPSPEGEGAGRCMAMALKDAGLTPADIQYINAHGTSTPMNDKNETAAVKNLFGDAVKTVAMSSTKSMTGHLLGAAGGIESIVMALAIRDNVMPPTINYEHPDPECDMDYVPNTAREGKVDAALSNSMGFGGHNGTVIFRRMS